MGAGPPLFLGWFPGSNESPDAPPPRKVKKVESVPPGLITPASFALYNYKLIS